MLVENKQEIFQRISASGEMLEHFGVRRYGLFGSFVKGSQNAESDVDLLVEFEPGRKSFDGFMNLSFFLEELLGRKIVDLEIVWDAVVNNIPGLRETVVRMLGETDGQ